MKFNNILKEMNIISESTIDQLVQRWGRLTARQIGTVRQVEGGPILSGEQVKAALMKRGIDEDDPHMEMVVKTAESGRQQGSLEQQAKDVEAQVAAEKEAERKAKMASIKGGGIRKPRKY